MSKHRKKRDKKVKKPAQRTMNKHHLKNKVNGGKTTINNILWIKIEKHRAWHILFKNMDLGEVILFLMRVRNAKRKQEFDHAR